MTMANAKTIIFFEKCPEIWRDGFLIPVRNRLNNLIQREYLPLELKDKFVDKWGEKIIYDDKFIDWYCEMRRQ